MAIEVEENEARAKIEALAEKLGYSAVSFFLCKVRHASKANMFLHSKIEIVNFTVGV